MNTSYTFMAIMLCFLFLQEVRAQQVWLIDPATIEPCGMDAIERLINKSDRNPNHVHRYLISSPRPVPFNPETNQFGQMQIKVPTEPISLSHQIRVLTQETIGLNTDVHVLTDRGEEDSIDFLRGMSSMQAMGTALHFHLPSRHVSSVDINHANLEQVTIQSIPCGKIYKSSDPYNFFADLRAFISRASGLPETFITPQTDLRELHLDKFTIFEINTTIDDHFGLMTHPTAAKFFSPRSRIC